MPSLVALVPARAGSERVPGKNIRRLAGHPLIAYAIATAQQSGVADRVICSTDSEGIAGIARWYGADVPFLRPAEYATSTSPDIEWLSHTLAELPERYELFALIRPTSPFRGPATVRRALDELLHAPAADSIRAIEPVKQHPGKMWLLDGETMHPLLDQSQLEVPWHDTQFQALPPVYIQSSALEIAWTRVVAEGTLGGSVRLPFFPEGHEGLSIDREDDWARAEALLAAGEAVLPRIDVEPWQP
jgi:CMP-N-acetylneuraminic acid synthetase